MGFPIGMARQREPICPDMDDLLALCAYQLPGAGCRFGVATAAVCAHDAGHVDRDECLERDTAVQPQRLVVSHRVCVSSARGVPNAD